MKKLLLLTSILTIMFISLSFAKTYSIKKEKEGKYVEISQSDIEVVLSKGKVFQQKDSINVFLNIILCCMTKKCSIVQQSFTVALFRTLAKRG